VKGTIALILCVSAVAFLISVEAAPQGDGKAVFVAKCQQCHSVRSEGITEGGIQAAFRVNWTAHCNDCTPDLSGVGERRKPDWLKAYLKNDKKGRNGLKHSQLPVASNGKAYILEGAIVPTLADKEADAVIVWLMSVKKAPPDAMSAVAPPRPPAPPPTKAKGAPLPKEEAANLLLSAKNVAVIGETGKQMMERAMWDPDGERAKRNVEEVLTAWGRYTVVPHAEDADLVIVVTEFQKNLNIVRLANLVCEMKVYRGGQEPTGEGPIVWSGDASEGLHQPSRKVAEKFRDFVKALPARPPLP
jgi:mono/diheme cytochrome c family protein